jgi:hypothetical protein
MECTVIAVIAGLYLAICEPPTAPEPKKEEKEDVRKPERQELRVPVPKGTPPIPAGKRTPV